MVAEGISGRYNAENSSDAVKHNATLRLESLSRMLSWHRPSHEAGFCHGSDMEKSTIGLS